MTPLLSICIPTYNRCRYLVETLDSILTQWAPSVEIVISDNASTDATESVVYDYTRKHTSVRYSRAGLNRGPDANFLRVVSLARGAYCWLLSDDDVIRPGAIDTILREIESDHEIYTFSEVSCDHEMRPIAEPQRLATPDNRLEYDLSNSSDLVLFFKRSNPVGGIPFGLISVLVFKKSIWDAVPIPEAMMGTAYVHVYVLLRGRDQNTRLKYIPQALIMNRLNASYISTDPIRSFWITADGYQLLARTVFTLPQDASAREAFLAMARRFLSLKQLALLRIYCAQIQDWRRIEARLVELGYSPPVLATVRRTRALLRLVQFLVRAVGGIMNRTKQVTDLR